jgi:hypothetical protein
VSSPANAPLRYRRIAALGAALALAAASLLIVAAPASAHDELVSSDPAADATLPGLPAQLTLTFSGDLLGDAGATEVQVTDAAGALLADGSPVVAANVVTQPLSAGATGAIAVKWRTVSSDGHPISGEYAFTVTAPTTPTPSPTTSPSATPTPSPTATTSPSTTPATIAPTAAPAPDQSGGAVLPWIVLVLVGVAVLGGVVYLLVSRARRARELEATRMAGMSTPAETTPPDPAAPGSDGPSDR